MARLLDLLLTFLSFSSVLTYEFHTFLATGYYDRAKRFKPKNGDWKQGGPTAIWMFAATAGYRRQVQDVSGQQLDNCGCWLWDPTTVDTMLIYFLHANPHKRRFEIACISSPGARPRSAASAAAAPAPTCPSAGRTSSARRWGSCCRRSACDMGTAGASAACAPSATTCGARV